MDDLRLILCDVSSFFDLCHVCKTLASDIKIIHSTAQIVVSISLDTLRTCPELLFNDKRRAVSNSVCVLHRRTEI